MSGEQVMSKGATQVAPGVVIKDAGREVNGKPVYTVLQQQAQRPAGTIQMGGPSAPVKQHG